MITTPDLTSAARRMATLVKGVPDDALGRPTPCESPTVGDLLDHIAGAALAFRAAAPPPTSWLWPTPGATPTRGRV